MTEPQSHVRRQTDARVAFIVSRFPKITETFILYEILALERLGVATAVFALRREKQPVIHPEAVEMMERVHFQPYISRSTVRAHWRYFSRSPVVYVRTVAEVVAGTFGSARMFLGALVALPKAVAFAERMEAGGVTHIHAHFATHPTVAALVAHRLTGIPFSFTAHGSDLHVDKRMLKQKMAAAEFAITYSNYNKEAMAAASSPELGAKVRVIHSGVDLDVFRPPPARGVCAEPRIVCVASLEEVKGHRFLIEACRLLVARTVPFRLHIVGDGPLRSELMRLVERAGLVDRVVFHGAQTREQVAEILRACDIKVLASYPAPDGRREGMPTVLIEAMASGLPVVSTRLTGIPELVESGRTGILVAPADPVELADALQALCEDVDLRTAMGRAGRERAEQGFDRRRNVKDLAALFGFSGTPAR